MSAITEVKQSTGRWQLDLIEGTPREIIDQLTPFGHIAVAPGEIDVAQVGDNLLTEARYVGVYRGGKVAGEGFSLEGSGMAFWVGDEDGKGPLLETVAVSAATFAAAVTAVLPDAVEAGTLYSVGGSATLTHTFQWETSKSALNFIARAFGTPTAPVSWRINGNATIDAGPDTQLFRTTPTAILVKKDAVLRTGRGFDIIGVSGDLQLEEAYNDYTTKVVVIGSGEGGAYIAASATTPASAVLYNDMHGNPVSFTRLVDSIDEDGISVADALAASLLSRFDSAAYGATLSSDDFDVRGDFVPGDHVATFAPDIGFVDYDNEMYYEGVPINPLYLQVQGMTWPIPAGFTVGFRTMGGDWLDLSDYYRPTGGQTLIDVGDNPSGLTNAAFDVDRSRFTTDASVPATPVFGEFFTTHYLNENGETRAQILVTWTEPLNSDGSTIIDGHHYEIRHRPIVSAPYPATWGEAAQDTWDELFTWMQPRVPPFDSDEWHVVEAPFDVEQVMIPGLIPSVVYEFQIRAVDGANPPNRSAWSASTAFAAARDTLPPAQPAVPSVAGSRLAIQVLHHLGTSAGGTFNLDLDTAYLEVHVSGDEQFFPDDSTLVGRLQVNAALRAGTPVVGTFQVEEVTERYVRVVAVDRDGNRSNASNTATATAELIDDAHISDLTASKITAGTISTDLLLGGSIKTGESGQRLELNAQGLQAFDTDGDLTINLSSDPDDTAHYMQFKGDIGYGTETLASVTDEGIITAQAGYFEHLFLGGDNVGDKLAYEPARGIVAWGNNNTDDVQGRGPDLWRGYLELAFQAEEGRAYKVTVQGDIESSSAAAGERYSYRLFDGGSSAPNVDTSATHGAFLQPATLIVGRNNTIFGTWLLRCPGNLTPGTHRLLWAFRATEGTATLRSTQGPSLFYVEDVGPTDWYQNNAVLNDGGYLSLADGGGVSPPANPSPVQSISRTYTATWTGVYRNQTSFLVPGTENDYIEQGHNEEHGDLTSMIGFPPNMLTDLQGTTIASAKLTLYGFWWKNSRGGTVGLGRHTYTTMPTGLDWNELDWDLQSSSGWPQIGSVTVDLNTSFTESLNLGTFNGLIISAPGDSDDPEYQGKFHGAAREHPPRLTVVYTG